MKTKLLIVLFAFCTTTNAQYTKLLDFANTANGSDPWGSLVYDGTFLYGMTTNGGTNSLGTIFKIMPDGTGYVKLLDFAGAANGGNPRGSLIYDGTFLYGMTQYGGTNGMGTLFKIMPDGTGYVKLLDFSGAADGSSPEGSLFSDGTFLYGMTRDGGTNNLGTIFKILPDGTGFVKLLDFTGAANGTYPQDYLVYDGTFLYGMTFSGGTNYLGTIFKIMPDGTGYVKLLDFAGTANGSYPEGSLSYDGTFLYGMTLEGGANQLGTLFKIMPDGTGYAKLLDFAGSANGSSPRGSLISDGAFLFGMTTGGGTNLMGTVFKYQHSSVGLAENDPEYYFSIYPSPNNGIFTMQSSEKKYEVVIVNMLGEKMYSSQLNPLGNGADNLQIDLSDQAKGIYFVKIYDGEKVFTDKIIIQ